MRRIVEALASSGRRVIVLNGCIVNGDGRRLVEAQTASGGCGIVARGRGVVEHRPSPGAEVVVLPRVGGLYHGYVWREAA